MPPTSSSNPGATRHQGVHASVCRARSALAPLAHLRGVRPRDARARAIERASVTPLIADTTTTCGGRAVGDHDLHGVRDAGGVRERRAAELVMCGGEAAPGPWRQFVSRRRAGRAA